jgi:predicted nucleic acid-binding protein
VPNADRAVYVDSSALVKLVVRERWSTDLAVFLNAEADRLVSSVLAEVEVIRGVRVAQGGEEAEEEAHTMLRTCSLVEVDRGIVEDARRIAGPSLGTLDAIHAASAVRSGTSLLVTYDRQLGRAARALGMRVEAPGASHA